MCSYEDITFWHRTVRIVIVCPVVAVLQVVQENSVLDCWRMCLLSRIVRGMLTRVEERVCRERRCRAVGRQVQGGSVGEEVGRKRLVGGAGRREDGPELRCCTRLGELGRPEAESDGLKIGELLVRPTRMLAIFRMRSLNIKLSDSIRSIRPCPKRSIQALIMIKWEESSSLYLHILTEKFQLLTYRAISKQAIKKGPVIPILKRSGCPGTRKSQGELMASRWI